MSVGNLFSKQQKQQLNRNTHSKTTKCFRKKSRDNCDRVVIHRFIYFRWVFMTSLTNNRLSKTNALEIHQKWTSQRRSVMKSLSWSKEEDYRLKTETYSGLRKQFHSFILLLLPHKTEKTTRCLAWQGYSSWKLRWNSLCRENESSSWGYNLLWSKSLEWKSVWSVSWLQLFLSHPILENVLKPFKIRGSQLLGKNTNFFHL